MIMKSTTILELMAKDHAKLLKYLDIFDKELREHSSAALPSFRTFEWNLQKHFFIEERVIFTSYNPNYVGQYSVFLDMKKQHTILLERMDDVKKNIGFDKMVDLIKFKALLLKHKTFEENNVYPVIDKEVDSKTKQFIIASINEIL